MVQFRKGRVGEEIKKELSSILQTNMKDPRLGFVSILKVDVAGDMKTAKVYVSHLAGEKELAESMKALKSGAGFMRTELSKRFRTRTVPELIFIADDSIEYSMKIDKILEEANAQYGDINDDEEV